MPERRDYTKISALLAAIGVVLLSFSFFFLAKEVIELQGLRTRENIRELVQGDYKLIISRFQFLLEKAWIDGLKKGSIGALKGVGKSYFKVNADGRFEVPKLVRFDPLPVVSGERRKWIEETISKARNLVLEGKKEDAYSTLTEALKACHDPSERAILTFETARVAEKILPTPLVCDLLAEIIDKTPGALGLDGMPLAPLASMRLAALLKQENALEEERKVLKSLLTRMASGAWEMDSFSEDYLFNRALEEWGSNPPEDVMATRRLLLLVKRFVLPRAGMEGWKKSAEQGDHLRLSWVVQKIGTEVMIAGYRKINDKGFIGVEGVILDVDTIQSELSRTAGTLVSSGGGFLMRSAEGGYVIAREGNITPDGIRFEGALPGSGPGIVLTVSRPFPPISSSEKLIPWAGFLLIIIALGGGSLLGIRSLQHEVKLARMQREFVDNISHELRTPITSIILNSELLTRRGISGRAMESAIKHIQEEGQRLERMVSDILDISRFSRVGASWITPRETDPIQILERALMSHLPLLKKKGFCVETHVDEEIRNVYADPEAASRALGNLIGNAAKYSGESREIQILLRNEGSNVCFHVVDHGIGVPEGEENKIFQRFYRAKGKAGNVSGVGLGLAVAKEIAEALKGDIFYKPTEGGGSTFVFILPAFKG